MKLRGLVPNFHIHVSVRDLYIPTIGPPIFCSIIGGLIVEITVKIGHEVRAVPFLGIFVSNFLYSVFAVHVWKENLFFPFYCIYVVKCTCTFKSCSNAHMRQKNFVSIISPVPFHWKKEGKITSRDSSVRSFFCNSILSRLPLIRI
jgi:hypothetical protein